MSSSETRKFIIIMEVETQLREAECTGSANPAKEEVLRQMMERLIGDPDLFTEFIREFTPELFHHGGLTDEEWGRLLGRKPFRETLLKASDRVSPEALQLVKTIYEGNDGELDGGLLEGYFYQVLFQLEIRKIELVAPARSASPCVELQ